MEEIKNFIIGVLIFLLIVFGSVKILSGINNQQEKFEYNQIYDGKLKYLVNC